MWIPHPGEGKREIRGKREERIRVKIASARVSWQLLARSFFIRLI